MATADQIKSLIRVHFEQDNERFKTITIGSRAKNNNLG